MAYFAISSKTRRREEKKKIILELNLESANNINYIVPVSKWKQVHKCLASHITNYTVWHSIHHILVASPPPNKWFSTVPRAVASHRETMLLLHTRTHLLALTHAIFARFFPCISFTAIYAFKIESFLAIFSYFFSFVMCICIARYAICIETTICVATWTK